MSVFRIGWVNPREDGDQAPMLKQNCDLLKLKHDSILRTGCTFKGKCNTCQKVAFSVLYDTESGMVGWACKLHKDEYDFYNPRIKRLNKCYICEDARPLKDHLTCEQCTPRPRQVSTGCSSCDMLFEGTYCLLHQLQKGLMHQCVECRVFYSNSKAHVCAKTPNKTSSAPS